jgi:NAD(P)H-dependent FMN reductase
MLKIGIILGSTRPNRVGPQVAAWVEGIAAQRDDASVELVDLCDQALPHLDEPFSPMLGQYQHEHTKAWAAKIVSFDALIFVTPEYNHGLPGALKNAIDFLHAEWDNKAVGIVSYGIAGGTGAAAQLRQICGQLGMADVRSQVGLNLRTEFEDYSVFKPSEHSARILGGLLDQVVGWGTALASQRAGTVVKA